MEYEHIFLLKYNAFKTPGSILELWAILLWIPGYTRINTTVIIWDNGTVSFQIHSLIQAHLDTLILTLFLIISSTWGISLSVLYLIYAIFQSKPQSFHVWNIYGLLIQTILEMFKIPPCHVVISLTNFNIYA